MLLATGSIGMPAAPPKQKRGWKIGKIRIKPTTGGKTYQVSKYSPYKAPGPSFYANPLAYSGWSGPGDGIHPRTNPPACTIRRDWLRWLAKKWKASPTLQFNWNPANACAGYEYGPMLVTTWKGQSRIVTPWELFQHCEGPYLMANMLAHASTKNYSFNFWHSFCNCFPADETPTNITAATLPASGTVTAHLLDDRLPEKIYAYLYAAIGRVHSERQLVLVGATFCPGFGNTMIVSSLSATPFRRLTPGMIGMIGVKLGGQENQLTQMATFPVTVT